MTSKTIKEFSIVGIPRTSQALLHELCRGASYDPGYELLLIHTRHFARCHCPLFGFKAEGSFVCKKEQQNAWTQEQMLSVRFL